MKTGIRKILYFDKALMALFFLIALVIIFTIMSVMYARNYEHKNEQLHSRLTEMRSLSGDTAEIKAVVESKEKKINVNKKAGIVSTLEHILKTLGLEAKIIKPLGKTKANEFTEESAELEIEGADLNSIVNLLYKIDISPMAMKISTAAIKSTFEDPDKFIFKLKVSLMSRK